MGDGKTRNIKLTVEYDGSAYAGWQEQRDCPTVQGELRRAVEQVVRHPVELQGASRTDRGVHALGQIANFQTERDIPARNLRLAINTHLPDDIVVVSGDEVDTAFDSRFSAVGKHYRYTFFCSPTRSAFHARWTSRCADELDVSAMRRAGRHLVGENDFAPFRNRSKQEPPNTIRTVYAVEVSEEARFVFIDVVGKSFLYNMVRVIAGTLLDVGVGKLEPDAVLRVFQSGERNAAGPTAEAQGLCLHEVFYDEARLSVVERDVREGALSGARTRSPLLGPPPG